MISIKKLRLSEENRRLHPCVNEEDVSCITRLGKRVDHVPLSHTKRFVDVWQEKTTVICTFVLLFLSIVFRVWCPLFWAFRAVRDGCTKRKKGGWGLGGIHFHSGSCCIIIQGQRWVCVMCCIRLYYWIHTAPWCLLVDTEDAVKQLKLVTLFLYLLLGSCLKGS